MQRNPVQVFFIILVGLPGIGSSNELTPLSRSFIGAGFELVEQTQGVSVYQDESSEVIRIGADAFMEHPPAVAMEGLLSYDNHLGYIKRLRESRILKKTKDSMLVYQRLNLPIIDDRDFNLLVTWGCDHGVHWLQWQAVSQGVKPRPGIVRVTDHRGSWQLESIDKEITQSRFQVRLDMAGWIPRWLVRSGAADEIPEFISSIRRMLAVQHNHGGVICKSNSS